ncbi:MAG: ferrochelatase [Anaerolineae bacterium]|nr:ferrochelatase [Anaerolineae bacterium]
MTDSHRDAPYDAVLIVAFGGPEGMEDVMPFLENVLAGRNVPHSRMLQVAEHYRLFNGISPLNSQMRALKATLQAELNTHGPHLPVYWGNRNWHPFLVETLRQMAQDGVRRALALFTSAYSSYSSCRQYREDIARAQAEVGPTAPQVDKLRVYYNHPGFIAPNIANLRDALEQIPLDRRKATRLVFTGHSLPIAMARYSAYEHQLREACRLVAGGVDIGEWDLVFQSRSGSPQTPWLGPDILDHMSVLRDQGAGDVIVHPIGFISDHMEVLYDLDVEARQHAQQLGLNMVRVATVGTHPMFISMIRELIEERLTPTAERRALGRYGPSHDVCPPDCCPAGETMRPRTEMPQ